MLNSIKSWYRIKKIRQICDYTKMRNKKIKGNEIIANSKLFFYYDETENFGRMYINLDNKTGYNKNPQSPVFMVGGIWSNNEIKNESAQELIDKIKVKGNPKEIKFKHVFGVKSNFEKF